MKATVQNIFARLGITENEIVAEQTKSEIFSAALVYKNRGGKVLGQLGIVARKIAKAADIDQEVYFAEFDWNSLLKMALKKKVEYQDLPKSMAVKRDLALLLNADIPFAEVEKVIKASEKRLLKSVTYSTFTKVRTSNQAKSLTLSA